MRFSGLYEYRPAQDAFALADGMPGPAAEPSGLYRAEVVWACRDGQFWASLKQHNLICIDPATGKATDYSASFPAAYPLSDIRNVYEDPDGNMWLGTGNGLLKVSRQNRLFSTHLAVADGQRQTSRFSMRGLVQDSSGTIYAGSYKGLVRFDPHLGNTKVFSDVRSQEMIVQNFYALADGSNGQLWLGSEGAGLVKFDKQREKFTQIDLQRRPVSDRVRFIIALLPDQARQRLWLGTYAGLYVYDERTGEVSPFADQRGGQELSEVKVWSLLRAADGKVWVGTDLGCYVLNTQGEVVRHYREQLSHPQVRALLEDEDGGIWLGTGGGGLNHIEPGTGKVQVISVADGLPNEIVNGMQPGLGRQLWITTDYGISCLDRSTLYLTNYFAKDGLADNEFNHGSLLRARDGRLLAGGINGLSIIEPNPVLQRHGRHRLLLTTFSRHDGKQGRVVEQFTGLDSLKQIELLPADKFFRLDVTLTDFAQPHLHHFSYRLIGYDPNWVYLGNYTRVGYNSLPPGRYLLQVKGVGARGTSEEQLLTIPVLVHAPFYLSWWFLVLIAAGAAAILYLLHGYRVQRILELERLRTRIASDLHDEVGSWLTRISIQTELIRSGAFPEQEQPQAFSRLSMASRMAVSSMSDVVWGVDTRHDQVHDLLDRMREHAASLLSPRGILYSLQTADLPASQVLDRHVRQNVFLIYKEAIHNVAKHAEASTVEIFIGHRQGRFELCVADNGTGSAEPRSQTGMGMRNMQMRARLIGAELQITTGDGYRVTLTRAPLHSRLGRSTRPLRRLWRKVARQLPGNVFKQRGRKKQ